nr:MAG TPA: hypothetical protein [Caudoviricetes sp.]
MCGGRSFFDFLIFLFSKEILVPSSDCMIVRFIFFTSASDIII